MTSSRISHTLADRPERVVAPANQWRRGAWTLALALISVSAALFICTVPLAFARLIHPYNGQFATGAGQAEDLAVDSANDVYVLDVGSEDILKFDSNGNPVNFSALGTNVLDGASLPAEKTPTDGFSFARPSSSSVAVDNSGGPANGDIYVTNPFAESVNVFNAAGEYLADLPFFGRSFGLNVNSAGTVIVSLLFGRQVLEFTPKNANPAEDTEAGSLKELGFDPSDVAIDSTGAAYVSNDNQNNGPLIKYEAAQFESAGSAIASPFAPDPFAPTNLAVETDPANNDVYVDSGNEITAYSSGVSGTPSQSLPGSPLGEGHLSGSRGIAIDDCGQHDLCKRRPQQRRQVRARTGHRPRRHNEPTSAYRCRP